MSKQELAEFLRGRRAALQPAEVGLPHAERRRTPGLRREEVALLASMSTNYYERLEQARAPRPSTEVIAALARALRLTEDEQAHLARIAGQTPPALGRPSDEVPPGVLQLLHRMEDMPAYVLNAKYDVLVWNALAAKLIPDLERLPAARRNVLLMGFDRGNTLCSDAGEAGRFARQAISDLRKAAARYPADTGITALIAELSAHSEDFAANWTDSDIRAEQTLRKRFRHPDVGVLELDCQTLHIPETDQRLVVYSSSAEQRDALHMVGHRERVEGP